MKKIVAVVVLAFMLVGPAAQAKTVVRPGADYDGYANPGGCVIKKEGSELHVNCKDSDKPARIRYRYLKEYGIKHGPAEFTAVVEKHGGTGQVDDIRWMDPTPRTGRVIIPAGMYAHIVEVRWSR